MSTKVTIAKRGFRRWYERKLFEAFAWLTICVLCGVAFAAVLAVVGFKTPGFTPILTVLALYLIGLLALISGRKFTAMLVRAQACSSGATCSQCGGYGLFDIEHDEGRMPVTCRRCGHRWTIIPSDQDDARRETSS
jgi:DNA-directed RNA polymerase subunit RPC12/RpoP